jgi:hypothetical protein
VERCAVYLSGAAGFVMSSPAAEATELLAACLYLAMERIDPSGRGEWGLLGEGDKEFYRASIRAILLEKTLLKRAMGDSSD